MASLGFNELISQVFPIEIALRYMWQDLTEAKSTFQVKIPGTSLTHWPLGDAGVISKV